MTEKDLNLEQETTKVEDNTKKYVETIETLKKEMGNMVSKDEYEKIIKERDQVLDSYVNHAGTMAKQEREKKEEVDYKTAAEYEQDLIRGVQAEVTNMEHWRNVLNHRDAVLRETGNDVFSIDGTRNEENDTIAEAVREQLENSKTTSEFNYNMDRITMDDPKSRDSIMAYMNSKNKKNRR